MAEKRLIDANALKAEIVDFKVNLHPKNQDYGTGYFSALSVVEGMLAYAPTVDAVEVVHGRWISEVVRKPDWKGKMRDYYQASSCSVCHKPDPGHGTSNYCPNCGARMMDGDGNG